VAARFLIWNDFNRCTEFPGLFGDDGTDAIHGGFVVGRRFSFDEEFEELG
jgi:hypothetical protein